MLEQGAQPRAQVRRLRVESGRAALLLRHHEHPLGVAVGERLFLSRLRQPLAGVHADGLEEPVAAPRGALLDRHERLLGEPRERIRRHLRVEAVAGAHLLDGVELEPAGEYGQPPEEHRFVGLEQVVAPLQRRRQRLLPRRRGVAAVAQDPEAVVEPLRDRRRAQRAESTRGELERERQAVESQADARDILGDVLVELEPGCRRRGSLDEERDGLVLEQLLPGTAPVRDPGCRARGRERRPLPPPAAARGSLRGS